jgi:hypothetical protein
VRARNFKSGRAFDRAAGLCFYKTLRAMPKSPPFDVLDSVEDVVEQLRSLLRPGDEVLFKEQGEQKLSRILLELSGREVRCRLVECKLENILCSNCPCLGMATKKPDQKQDKPP